ncbi:MAG: GGDEF domain-containing protein [Actinomycetota bacterium]
MGKPVKSLIISCGFDGTINEVICDKMYMGKKKLEGSHFTSFIDTGSRDKALSFLEAVNSENSLFNHELNIVVGGRIKPFSFSGVKYREHILMIISNAHTILNDMFEEVAAVNNEQANILRSLSKETAMFAGNRDANLVSDAFDQISRLNNELVNMQRELAIKNKELQKLNQMLKERSIRDLLTGLYNRRFFYEKIEEEINRANRLGYQIVLASLDINNFKSINDKYGHLAGDRLLISFADILKKSLRKNFDSVFRFGGDEFVVLLVNCDLKKAKEILEKINRKLTRASKEVSLAYGMAKIPPEGKEDIDQYLKISDQKMYKHKEKYKDFPI